MQRKARRLTRIIDTVEAYAPGFRASILGRQILSPKGLERKFGLVGGDIMHGNMSAGPVVDRAPCIGPWCLSWTAEGAVYVWRRYPSRRRRDRRARSQLCARSDRRHPLSGALALTHKWKKPDPKARLLPLPSFDETDYQNLVPSRRPMVRGRFVNM
jgi:hypothetical protein